MRKELINNNPIVKLSIEFALLIIEYCEQLESGKKFVIARQLLKSGTSIGANIMEAQNPESKADFIHKIKIAAKEAEETQYWLLLCDYAQTYPECKKLGEKVEEINKIISKIISSSRKKSPVSYFISLFFF